MTFAVSDAELEVWFEEGEESDEPDVIIGEEGLNTIEFSHRANDVLDEAKIDLDLPKSEQYNLSLGDRVRFTSVVSAGPGYGETYGIDYGSGETIEWMGRIRPNERARNSPGYADAALAADAVDYVGDILSNRNITGSWVNKDVGVIIRDIIQKTAPEVDASNVPDFGTRTDVFFQNRNCFDAVVSLAAHADALLRQERDVLYVEPLNNLPYAFDLTPDDYNLPWNTKTDDNVSNVVRVDSGVSRQEEQSQPNRSAWQRVTQTNRITHRIRARKSEIHSIRLHVRKQSNDDLRVRLQADEGGAPIAVNDEDSDIQSEQWPSGDLPSEGTQSIFFADHTLPDRDPWLIIEAAGDEGQDIGVDANGVPTFTSYYPHPLNFEAAHQASIDRYGERELRIERENLETLAATRDATLTELARRAYPSKTIKFPADSGRAHGLSPGDIIGVDNPTENAVGNFIVVEVERSFDAGRVALDTSITASWRRGILAP